ncbi:MAG: hypothetical protein LBV33_07435, partial [Lachnospiraceae bacterium]|nr:hypothetical protein [Lachnospiraceae bacterium]
HDITRLIVLLGIFYKLKRLYCYDEPLSLMKSTIPAIQGVAIAPINTFFFGFLPLITHNFHSA